MSAFPPPRTNWTAIIGVTLTAASMYAFGIRYVVRLNEADETKTKIIARLESKVEDQERERNEMAKALTRIEVKVEGVSDDMRDVKGDVRDINSKLPRRNR